MFNLPCYVANPLDKKESRPLKGGKEVNVVLTLSLSLYKDRERKKERKTETKKSSKAKKVGNGEMGTSFEFFFSIKSCFICFRN